MSKLSKRTREGLLKTFAVLTAVTTIMSLSGFMYLAPNWASAAVPSDYGLVEGNTISAAGSDDPDVYIVNDWGYKRLFLSPQIFNLYGHLGGFANVKSVSAATRDAFPTSGLFRVDGDEKVYGIETTGEDVASLHWVNTSGSQAVADDPNFFKKVFVINAAEFALYSVASEYSSVNQVPAYTRGGSVSSPTPVAGNVSVSLASSNPSAQTVTQGSYGVNAMVMRFSGTGTVNELSFKRGGAGATTDYDNLYIYDGARRLTAGRTLSSSEGTVTFISLNVAVSGTKDLTLVGDHSSTAGAGNVNNFSLTNVKIASGTVSGYPVVSNNFTVSGSDSGGLTVAKSGSVANPKVGQKATALSEFKVTANTEASYIRRIQLYNGGDVKATDLTNLYLEVSSVKVAETAAMTSDGYAVFDFGTPGYKITKGDYKIFRLFGDLAGKKSETVKFYVEYAADVLGIGDQYGYGMKATITDFDSSATGESHNLTLQGGVLTITMNGPNATNVGTTTSDTILARYSFAAANNIEVKKTRLVLCLDNLGSGTFTNAAATTNGWYDLEDIKVVDEDSGTVLVGPADGSTFTASEATGCPDSKTGAAKTFTDMYDLVASQTRNLKVTADIKTGNTNGTTDTAVALDSTDIIKVVLDGYGEADLSGTSGDVAVLKYTGTSTAVDDSDVVPNADLSGNNMTIQSSSLTLGLSSSPTSTTYVKGTSGIDAVGITFAASLASDLKVTDITLTGYVKDESGDTLAVGVDTNDSSVTVGNLVSAVKLYDGDSGALISETPSSNNLNSTTGTIVFNNLAWNIPAGQTKKLLVKTNLSSNAPSGSNDYFSFDINTTSDVSAVDNNSATVNAGNSDPNSNTTGTVKVTVSSAGTLAVSLAPSNPISAPVYWGQADTEFTNLRIRSTNEAFLIERLNVFNLGDTKADVLANVDQVKLTYTNKAGTSLTSVGSFNQDTRPSVSFGFTGDNRPYIPKDSSADIKVTALMKTKAQGATSEVNFSIDFSGVNADEFRAVGEGSGTVIAGDTSGSTIDDLSGNNMYAYRAFPKVEQISLSSGTPIGTKDVLKFKITVMGLSDSKILFDDPASVGLKFEAVASGGTDADLVINLYDADSGALYASQQTQVNSVQDSPTVNASISFTDWEQDVEITGGQSKTFRVEVAFQNFLQTNDYFQLVMRDEASQITYVDGARSGEDQMVTNVASIFKSLPMNGPIFVTP